MSISMAKVRRITRTLPRRGFNLRKRQALVAVAVVLLVGAAGFILLQRHNTTDTTTSISTFSDCVTRGNTVTDSYPEQCSVNGQDFVNENQSAVWNTVIGSGEGGFALTIPDGWGLLLNDPSSDHMAIQGMKQPKAEAGKSIAVERSEDIDTSKDVVFSVSLITDSNSSIPHGSISDFTLGKGARGATGKKYSYEYAADDGARRKGDRDYMYVFDIEGERTLQIVYRVYASDAVNQVNTVDRVVHSIRLGE